MKNLRFLIFLCAPLLTLAQPVLRLKIPPAQPGIFGDFPSSGRIHVIVQFEEVPGPATLLALAARGAILVDYVPDHGVLITADQSVSLIGLGVRFAGPLTPQQKISPLIANGSPSVNRGNYVVEFHPDVNPSDARRLLLNFPMVQLLENPDLASRHLMIYIPDLTRESETLASLAAQDLISYVFPASPSLIERNPVAVYVEALSQNFATIGDGWDGPGANAATIYYYFSHLTAQLPELTVKGEIRRALANWAEVAQINWLPGVSSTADRTLNFLFAQGEHGDGYPFDGPGGVLAHTFSVPFLSADPILGDVHFDDSEVWRVGANFDVFSVALHEIGHALGLAHSDDPNAVMYPYYKLVSGLTQDDKDAILMLYAPQTGTPPPPPSTLTLTVNTPPAITTAPSISLFGTVTGGSGFPRLAWSSSTGASGTVSLSGANWIALVPLELGLNTITVTATDATGEASQTVTLTRQDAASPLTLTVTALPATTTAATISVFGTVTGGSGSPAVSWTTSVGAFDGSIISGSDFVISNLPLVIGLNTITVTAADATSSVSHVVTIMRTAVTPPPLLLTVNAPPATTTAASISLTGTVTGGSGSPAVSWTTIAGAFDGSSISGTAWVISNLPLVIGLNTITVTAADATSSVSRIVTITRLASPPSGTDTTAPTLTITYPSSTSFTTTLASLTFKGTASDRSGVASVTWSTNTGGAGTASGTTQWSALVTLLVGSNQVIIRAIDTAGNMSWKSVVVTRR